MGKGRRLIFWLKGNWKPKDSISEFQFINLFFPYPLLVQLGTPEAGKSPTEKILFLSGMRN
jgi:hypothetical protein